MIQQGVEDYSMKLVIIKEKKIDKLHKKLLANGTGTGNNITPQREPTQSRGGTTKSCGLASSVGDLQLAMGHFAAECNTAGMRNNCSKSDAKILRRKRVECQRQGRNELLPQTKEFKYLGFLFTCKVQVERETDK